MPAQRLATHATLATSKCIAERSFATKKGCCSVAYRSALVARTLSRQTTPKPRCNIIVLNWACCTTLDTEILHNLCRVRLLQCELGRRIPWSKLQHGTTCCNAYIEAATTGLSRAMETPSQIVVTAAAAVAYTASMKSKQSRAPAVGILCCAVHASTRAGTTACVVNSALLA